MDYLNLIQQTINRMANNSFLLKGWAVTIVSAIFVLSASESNKYFTIIAMIPIVLFFLLDAYYLQSERRYRVLYNKNSDVSQIKTNYILSMPKSNKQEKTLYIQCVFSKTEWPFYFALIGSAIVAFFVIG